MRAPVRPSTRSRGAALLVALLTVALVTTLASAALWRQWQQVAVEQSERDRQQAQWILTGALDWARLILREDARTNQNTGAGDHLAEPWAVGLEEARLSSFLAADKSGDPPPALDAFLSGRIADQQGLLNVANLVQSNAVSREGVEAFERLFQQLALPKAWVLPAANAWLRATSTDTTTDGVAANRLLRPQRIGQLGWLGWNEAVVRRLAPFITVLPERTPVNLNTAPPEVLMAVVPRLDRAQAQRIVTQRALQPFRTLVDVGTLIPGIQTHSDWHSTHSRYFLVLGQMRLEDKVLTEESLVVRNGLEVRTLWRQRVPPPSASNPDPASLPQPR